MKLFLPGLCFLLLAGCNLLFSPSDGKPDTPLPPVPPPVVVYTEDDYWNQLAKAVDAGVFLNSDDLCSACDKLKLTGELKDLSRLAEVRKTRTEPISGDGKAKILAALKGK